MVAFISAGLSRNSPIKLYNNCTINHHHQHRQRIPFATRCYRVCCQQIAKAYREDQRGHSIGREGFVYCVLNTNTWPKWKEEGIRNSIEFKWLLLSSRGVQTVSIIQQIVTRKDKRSPPTVIILQFKHVLIKCGGCNLPIHKRTYY